MSSTTMNVAEYRIRLESMVADASIELHEYRMHNAPEDCAMMASELNGLCIALRLLDEARYEGVSFLSQSWARAHARGLYSFWPYSNTDRG